MDSSVLFVQWQNYAPLANTEFCTAAFNQAVEAYRQAHRHYHTLRHIQSMLRLLDESGFMREEVFWATWFHDYVYDPQRSDNEEASAVAAHHGLLILGVPSPCIDATVKLILATKLHEVGARPEHEQAFLDADMAILGAPAEIYDEYAANVRKEFSMYPDDQYRVGRARFIEKTLQGGEIFGTGWFRARFEQWARTNLERELSVLA